MKNLFKFLGIISMVLVIGFSMAACGDDGGGDGGGGGAKYTKAIYYNSTTPGYSRIELGSATGTDVPDSFNVDTTKSTLPGFEGGGTTGYHMSKESQCGFSVKVGATDYPVKVDIYTKWTAGTGEIDLYFNDSKPNNEDTITVSYTPDGTHVFKNTEGASLGAFSITALGRSGS